MIDRKTSQAAAKALLALSTQSSHTATVYLSPTLTVRVTRVRINGRFNQKRADLVLTIGKPNARARTFIKTARRAGEPFPIKKVQLSGR